MSVLLRAITCATFLLLLLPVSAAGQALYADGAGAYLTVSPFAQQHSDGQVGTMSGATDFIPALAAAAAVAFALDDRRSIVVEPAVQLRPGFFWIPIPRAGLSARVNL